MKDEYKEMVCRVRFIDGVPAKTYLSDVEIVRRKDCIWHDISTFRELVLHRCYVNPDDVETSPDGYCYLGKGKGNE